MSGLRAEFMRRVPSLDGPQADVVFIEPNGAEHQVWCLCKPDGTTELGVLGDPGQFDAPEDKYGPQSICGLARQFTLAHG